MSFLPCGWMKDSPESLIGEAIVQGSRDSEGLFRVARFGGIQPARVMGATTGIGAERIPAFPSHAQEVCEARIDTPC